MQLILDIFNQPELAQAAEVEEILGQIKERRVKLAELLEKCREANQAVLDTSLEIDELVNIYSQKVFTLKTKVTEDLTGVSAR